MGLSAISREICCKKNKNVRSSFQEVILKKNCIAYIYFAGLIASTALSAQIRLEQADEPGVMVQVVDPSRAAIADANIRVRSENGQEIVYSSTNQDGQLQV